MAMFRHHPMTFRARRGNPRPSDELEQGILDRHGACVWIVWGYTVAMGGISCGETIELGHDFKA